MVIVTIDALHSGKIDQLYRYILAGRNDPFFFSTMAEMAQNYRSLTFNGGRNFYIALHIDEICGTIGMMSVQLIWLVV